MLTIAPKKVRINHVTKIGNVKVESGVPLPSRGNGGQYGPLFRKMKKGDSFFLDGGHHMRVAVCQAARHIGVKTATRKEGTGYRIWRKA